MTSTTTSTCIVRVASKIGTMGSRHWRLTLALCLALANAACSKDEPTKEQRLSRADAAFAAGQSDKAEKEYRDVLRVAPDDPTALRQLGILYFDQGQIRQAYALLKRSAELQPDDAEIQLKISSIMLALRDYGQARDAAAQVLDKQPDSELALLLLADASRNPDDIADARKRVQSLREGNQDRPKFHLALGVLDARQNDQATRRKRIQSRS